MGTVHGEKLLGMLDGQGVPIEIVEREFGEWHVRQTVVEATQILRENGVRGRVWITKLPDGTEWVVKNNRQRERLIWDRKADAELRVLLDGEQVWSIQFVLSVLPDVPVAVVDSKCRELGYYEVDGDGWLRYVGWELVSERERARVMWTLRRMWKEGLRSFELAWEVVGRNKVSYAAFKVCWEVLMWDMVAPEEAAAESAAGGVLGQRLGGA